MRLWPSLASKSTRAFCPVYYRTFVMLCFFNALHPACNGLILTYECSIRSYRLVIDDFCMGVGITPSCMSVDTTAIALVYIDLTQLLPTVLSDPHNFLVI